MTRPVRVLELRSVAGTGGGPDKTLVATADLRDPSVDLTLAYLCNEGDEQFQVGALARQKGLNYLEVRERGAINLNTWQTLRDLARTRRFDVIHGHDYKTDLLAWLLARRTGGLPFATAHGWTGHSWRERALYYPMDRRLLVRFPKVVAVSGEIKDTLVRAGAKANRIDVILNGIDSDRFRRDPSARLSARERYGLRPDHVVIGAVGRLEPQKRFDLLIDAVGVMAAKAKQLYVLIAGEGSCRAALEAQIARLQLSDRVRLAGQVDVIPFHHAIDLFVQSSDYEGTPNVVLEAMAMESPIVATDVGGTRELAEHERHAIIVQPGDAAALAVAIGRALDDPEGLAARARAGRRRVETDLSFSRRTARVHSLYAQLISEQADGRR